MPVSLLNSLKPETLDAFGPDNGSRLKALRRKGWERFESLPWPGKTDEEWRRTDPEEIHLKELDLQPGSAAVQVGWEPIPPEWIRSGVILTDLNTAIKQFPDLVDKYLFKTGTPEGLAKFTALHEALWGNGIFCYIPEGVRVTVPLKAWIEATQHNSVIFPHTLIVAGKGAEATLIQERRSPTDASMTSTEMVEILVHEGATLRTIYLQKWGPSVTEIFSQRTVVGREATLMNLNVGLGGRLTKANVETVLQETGAHAELFGILLGTGERHMDFHTLQDHNAPHTFSDLLYKSALKDRSQSIYTGLIRIRKHAEKSDAYQANRNLLLSDGATADSVPMLEIETNDVRCTHGVAVGPIDEEQAFYLMSRGVPPAEAEHLITEGFFDQVFKRLPVGELGEQMLAEVTRRLDG